MSVTITFSDRDYDYLCDTVSSAQDEGPWGEGWRSDKLQALVDKLIKQGVRDKDSVDEPIPSAYIRQN